MDVGSMKTEEFCKFIMKENFPELAASTFRDQYVDGAAFLQLSEGELKEMFPRAAGIWAKLRHLKNKVSNIVEAQLCNRNIH